MYISEKIGKSYEQWIEGDVILITGPTGSGKSRFIFYDLLPWAIRQGHRILYCVNRRILEKQLQKELDSEVRNELYRTFADPMLNVENYISIETYQNIEKNILDNKLCGVVSKLKQYDIVVYDECHYFYADSGFNTNTEISFDCLRKLFDYKIQIFISATINKMRKLIENRYPMEIGHWKEACRHSTMSMCDYARSRIKEYTLDKEYDYIKVHSFDTLEMLEDIIKEERTGKWLIFIDSLNQGQKLKNNLVNRGIQELDIVFINADYKNDEDASESVESLAKQNYTDKKIIITTAVMDNGISFIDQALRSIVIFYDTEEEFIQMLGRKREDGKEVNLYINKRSAGHFRQRFQFMSDTQSFLFRYKNTVNGMYIRVIGGRQVLVTPYFDYYYRCFPMLHTAMSFSLDYDDNYLNHIIFNEILSSQQTVMNGINSEKQYEKAKAIFYTLGGLLAINSFSAYRCSELVNYYQQMFTRLQEDENAFLKEQLRWMGVGEEQLEATVNEIIKDESIKVKEKLEYKVIELLGDKKEARIDSEQNKKFKMSVIDQLIYFYSKSDERNDNKLSGLRKNDRPISIEDFNIIMKTADLPYRMSKEKKEFLLTQIDSIKIKSSEPISKE